MNKPTLVLESHRGCWCTVSFLPDVPFSGSGENPQNGGMRDGSQTKRTLVPIYERGGNDSSLSRAARIHFGLFLVYPPLPSTLSSLDVTNAITLMEGECVREDQNADPPPPQTGGATLAVTSDRLISTDRE